MSTFYTQSKASVSTASRMAVQGTAERMVETSLGKVVSRPYSPAVWFLSSCRDVGMRL